MKNFNQLYPAIAENVLVWDTPTEVFIEPMEEITPNEGPGHYLMAQIVTREHPKPREFKVLVSASSLYTQLTKFAAERPLKGRTFYIKYMGLKQSPAGPFEFKSFVVKEIVEETLEAGDN